MMERKANVLVLHHSKKFARELIEVLDKMDEIKNVLYASSFQKSISLLLSGRVNIVLCGIPLGDEDALKLDNLCKTCKLFRLIILTDETGNYKKYDEVADEYFPGRLEELERLRPLILEKFNSIQQSDQAFHL